MFIGAHEAEYMFVTTLLKIEQHLLAQGRCPYSYLAEANLRARSSNAQQKTALFPLRVGANLYLQ